MAFENSGVPWATEAGTFDAEQTRRAVFAAYARTSANSPGIISGGLVSAGDLQLSAAASGLLIHVSPGEAIVPGNEGGAQGGYYSYNAAQMSLTLATANATNPRIDLICLTVDDTGYTPPSGGTGGQVSAQAVTGTPTSGATLSNLSGVGALPGSSLLLGYVLVPAAATNLTSADILNAATTISLQVGESMGHTNIATTETRTSTAYGTMPTPDQVTGIVLPANGLIAVWYQATVTPPASPPAGVVAIFVGANQLKTVGSGSVPSVQEVAVSNSSEATVVTTFSEGLVVQAPSLPYGGDVTTGQVVGGTQGGGPCYIFATAGTYTVSVQYKVSSGSGSVTASNRKLWVKALGFA